MNALDTLIELSSQMDLEHAEESRQPVGRVDGGSRYIPSELLNHRHRTETTHPSCFTPKARPEFTEREKRAAFTHPAQLPNGKNIVLLKTLLSSACERDCYYCPFRAGRDFRRATFKPDEFAHLFSKMNQSGMAQGVFLSSGIAGGGVRTQDKLLDTAQILRKKYQYRGYLHLKIMPGAEKDQVYRAMQLADRVSVNLEAPNTERLAKLAPHKIFIEELLRPLRWVEEIRQSVPAYKFWNGKYPSSVTQFVAGGADESDLELLNTTHWLIKNVRLTRAYYSAFHPIRDTPLENKNAVNPMREHRLYQASFLLRDYGFELEDLPFASDENLPLHADPKLVWANLNLIHNPIEINTADKHQLIKIPGIGIKGAEAIMNARRINKINSLSTLKKLHILADKASPFILLNGKKSAIQTTMSL